MYIIVFCAPIIPVMLLFPILYALYIDKKKNDHPITSNIKLLIMGGFIGSLVYLGVGFLGEFLGAEGSLSQGGLSYWSLILPSGIVLPVIFAGLYLYIKGRGQLKHLSFTRGGIGAGVFFLLFSAIPIVFPWIAWGITDIWVPMTILFFPVFFGLWVLLSGSNYTWRYFLAYAILSILSSLAYLFVLAGFSAQ